MCSSDLYFRGSNMRNTFASFQIIFYFKKFTFKYQYIKNIKIEKIKFYENSI